MFLCALLEHFTFLLQGDITDRNEIARIVREELHGESSVSPISLRQSPVLKKLFKTFYFDELLALALEAITVWGLEGDRDDQRYHQTFDA